MEVLAALTFAAIVLPVAMRGISLASISASESKKCAEATLLAQNLIAGIIAEGAMDFGSLSGDFLPENSFYEWTAELTEWQDGYLKELVVNVSWEQNEEERSISLATVVYTGGL